MALPETAKKSVGGHRQRHQAILVALGIAQMNAPANPINVGDRQPQPFSQTEAETVEREEKDAVTEYPCRPENPLGLLDGDDVRQALRPRWLNQSRRHPGLLQHVLVVKLEPVKIK